MLTPIFSFLILSIARATARVAPIAIQPAIQVRAAPGRSVEDTYNAIKRNLAIASLRKRDNHTAEISLARSWENATLFSIEASKEVPQNNPNASLELHAGIEVACQHCYVRGDVKAELIISDNFDAGQALNNTIHEVGQEFMQLGEAIIDYLGNYSDSVVANVIVDGPQKEDFLLPTFPYRFDLNITPIPDATVRFQFDQLEVYMDILTTISAGATYELNLFNSQSPVGIKIGDMQLGAVLTVDLIMSVDGEIAISNGFHIKLNDGVALNIALFGDEVSDMTFNGGQFEFLPVTVESAGIVLSAALRVGVSLGISVGPPIESTFFDVGAGMEVAVFANVAEFTAEVKHEADDEECAFHVTNEYKFAVGAVAGASMEIVIGSLMTSTVAAVADKSTDIFTATLPSVCAFSKTPAAVQPSVTEAVKRREDLTITTLTTEIVNSAVYCKVTGVANCAVSDQVSTKGTVTSSLITAVPSDWSSEWPQATVNSAITTVSFGDGAHKMENVSGTPTMYVAPTTGVVDDLVAKVGGVSKKVIIGVSVGLGVPIIIAVVACCLFFQRRKKYTPVSPAPSAMIAEPYLTETSYSDNVPSTKKAGVSVSEIRH